MSSSSGHLTFLFTDVEGSTSKWDRARTSMEWAMRRHDEIIEGSVSSGSGRVVKKTGDGFLAVFDDASNAVDAAVEAQLRLGSEHWDGALDSLAVRMGLNTGEATVVDDDYLGPSLNRAARIEAAGYGGQILLAGTTRESAEDRDDLSFRDLGNHFLRGLTRPERIFQVEGAGLRADFPPLKTESKPYRPSIAVLPFDTFGDLEREPFSDGLVEDIITELSRSKDLFVVARNSTLVYRERQKDASTVARELGVRYLLEGSVRWAGNHARVATQLIDGASGGHIWSKRYDHTTEDVFSVLDRVTEDIVSQLSGYHGAIVLAEKKRTLSEAPGSLSDYEAYIYGLELKHRFTPDANQQARTVLDRVLEHRPAFARAHVAVAWTWLVQVVWGWTDDQAQSIDKAWEHANKAVELDPSDAEVHWLLGELHMLGRDYDQVEAAYDKAKALNPNLADVYGGWAGVANKLGRPTEALESIELAKKLNPNWPAWYDQNHGAALYRAERYEESAKILKKARSQTPVSKIYLAAASQRSGDHEKARQAVESACSDVPGLNVSILETIEVYRDPSDQAHLTEAVVAAGLPVS